MTAAAPSLEMILYVLERGHSINIADVNTLRAALQADPVAVAEPDEMPTLPTLVGFRGLHPETLGLVMRFAYALACKLSAAETKYGYRDGWLRPDWMDECRAKLAEHVAKGDPRDVAAYCAFLWHHEESTAPPPTALQADQGAVELRSLVYKGLSDLVQLTQPEDANIRWRNDGELIDRGEVVKIVMRIKSEMDAYTAAPAAVPTGFVLVPVEPTVPMLLAMSKALGLEPLGDGTDGDYPITGRQSTVRQCFDALVADAPKPEAQP